MGKEEKKKEIGFDDVGIETEGDTPVRLLLTFCVKTIQESGERHANF